LGLLDRRADRGISGSSAHLGPESAGRTAGQPHNQLRTSGDAERWDELAGAVEMASSIRRRPLAKAKLRYKEHMLFLRY
jgi:hypothetical protein